MGSLHNLLEKIDQKQAVIGIVGLGYVGLPIVIRFADVGFTVIGFDIDLEKITSLNSGKSYIEHIPDNRIADAISNRFSATSDFSEALKADALIICVPTPLDDQRQPDLSFVLDTIDSLVPFLRKEQVVSLESTTYPGTTEEELLPRIESTGLKVGQDIFLVYSPEREDPGNPSFVTQTIPKVCGGCTEACLEAGVALYSHAVDDVVTVSSTRVAEMTKLLENIHRAVNIGLVNELKIVSDRMGINIHEVIDAAKTKPFGFTPYYPGPGLGGHCIPIDPFYLTWKARKYGVDTRFIELAGEVNTAMPKWVIGKLSVALENLNKSLAGSRILVLGIAYKKNVDDTRESPAMELIEILHSSSALVEYSDPHVPVMPKLRKHDFDMSSVELNKESLSQFDAALLVTDHDRFDYDLIREHSNLVVDTRGRYARSSHDNIVNA